MNGLIVYGTTEGQTRKIAEWAAAHLRERGHEAELRDSAAAGSGLNLERFDAFIIAASVHHEFHQASVRDFVMAHRGALAAKQAAFISVSLSAALEGGQAEARKYVASFLDATGWKPKSTLLLGGALRFTDYDYFQEQIVRFNVMKGDAPPGVGHEDREFTDWNALGAFIDGFLADASGGRAAAR
ncbi:MAG: flavodoxin domain-containing protein [Methyloceanibacter sp.]